MTPDSARRIPLFWDPRQDSPGGELYAAHADIPRLAVEAFLAAGLRVELRQGWPPLTEAEISLAHESGHVRRVLALEEGNGFGNSRADVAAAIPWELGSFHAAVREALATGGAAFSPSRGFHHADVHECWNFCSFNGLAVSALLLKAGGAVRRVGIIDFDCHWGNGTDAIIAELGLDWITHLSFGNFKRVVRRGIGFDAWLAGLPSQLEALFSDCDILFYQAGADPHIEDRFGGELTTEQLRLRDRIVFRFARGRGLPIAWNLAGGYQEPVSKVTALQLTSMEECVAAFI